MWRMVFFWISQVLGVLVSSLTLAWILKTRGFGWTSKQMFSWHPTFMNIGLVYLLGHGIVIFKLFPKMEKKHLKIIHMAINLAAGLSAGFALFAIIDHKNRFGKEHFQSMHSWIGIGTIALFATQWVAGVLIYLVPCSPNWLRSKTISWHAIGGKGIFILSVIASITGIEIVPGSADKETTTLLNVLGIVIVVSLLFHLFVLSWRKFRYARPSVHHTSNIYSLS